MVRGDGRGFARLRTWAADRSGPLGALKVAALFFQARNDDRAIGERDLCPPSPTAAVAASSVMLHPRSLALTG